MDARVEDEPVTDLHPQVVRDKILGALFPGSYVSLTRDELVDKTGLDAGVVNRELIQLIQSRLVSWPGAVANALKAIEFAAKSLLLMAGYEVPEEHAVGSFMNHVIDSLTGEEWAVKLTRAELARLAWLNEISAPLQIVSEYGYLGVPANEAITTRDADAWVESAKEAIYAVDHLLGLLTRGQLLFK